MHCELESGHAVRSSSLRRRHLADDALGDVDDLLASGVVGEDVVGDGAVLFAVVAGVPCSAHAVVGGGVASQWWFELGVHRVVDGDVAAGPGGA